MHPAVLDLRFLIKNVIHARNAPSLCCAARASSVICFNVHFFLLSLVMVDFCSFSKVMPVEIQYLWLLHLGNISR
ncbi:hypothetical protein ELI24_18035 [Rhizobium ruizarguesonis]|nr:hypothetical protein ELI24_18035 [Rhizobium ruizarguesonis]TAW17487.1 hypothetical protein ELI25_17480 [Rhizobium ruizarguesonis]TAZ53013.1 hypothetical protein ELH76_18485 [Rhizobium ruizarguesonis]